RYVSNDEFYQEGAPLFIFVGGETESTPALVTAGHLYDLAKEHNGHLFRTEHRYYGQSRPTNNLDNENIKYLHVRQAIADLAHFIGEMRATIPGATESKVILAGGSYSATLATWFKKLYPELVTGVWASSAPLLAKVNFVEYKVITGESIRLVGGEACYNRIEN
ncbi:putative serine protease K12H4.7, partial [Rhagoletis pomonella]|uniref:putative serine protease K12H4.7 n=1 Tax=Rhagoletis pomonella TaxID=28610 RepID=UPI0017844B4E